MVARNIIRARAWSTLIFLVWTWNAYGATYYVDATGGNDGNNGTSPETAWKTINKLNGKWSAMSLGDDVYFKRGETFAGSVPIVVSGSAGGTSGDSMIIGAYGTGAKPIIDGTGMADGDFYFSGGNHHYITIQDLDIRNGSSGISVNREGMTNITISRVDTSTFSLGGGIGITYVDTFTIEDCTVTNPGNSGIVVTGSATTPACNGTIRRNTVRSPTSNDCITLHHGGPTSTEYDLGSNFLLEDNVCSGAPEDGIDLTAGSDVILRGGEYHDCDHSGLGVGRSNVLIERCYVHDNAGHGILVGGGTNGLTIAYCIVQNSGRYSLYLGSDNQSAQNISVYNTVVYHTATPEYAVTVRSQTSGLNFKNNLVLLSAAATGGFISYSGSSYASTDSNFDTNIWWQPGRASFSLGTNSRFVDPQCVDLVNGDYSLRSMSPAIDTGLNVGLTEDFEGQSVPQGLRPDIGAFEYGAGVPVDTTAPGNVSNLSAVAGDGRVTLTWTNPTDADFAGVRILRKTGGSPTGLTDGTVVYQGPGTTWTDTGLVNGTTYYYRVFTYDAVPNYSSGISASATPAAATISYTLTISAVNGTVTRTPDQTSYTSGQTVTLTATANTGYTFTGWSGAITGTANPVSLVMDSDKSVTANFSADTYVLSITAQNGSVVRTPDQSSYTYGQTVSLQAVPNTGYSFTGWSGAITGTTNPVSLVMDGNKSVTAAFSLIGSSGENMTKTVGNAIVFSNTTTMANRQAVPYTMPQVGRLQSISIYHNGGTGQVLLGVYADSLGKPGTCLAVTGTQVNRTQGWQTIALQSPVNVSAGQKIWLAWIFQKNPGIRYTTATPGGAESDDTWSDHMPTTFGASSLTNYTYSIYATYSTGSIYW